MGLFDDIRNAAQKRQENVKRATEALDKIASPLKPEKYITGFEGEQIPHGAPRPTLTYSEAVKLISPAQMERLQSQFERKLWRDYNQSGAFEGDYTQEDAQRQASEDIKNAVFHVVRDEDKFYLYMTPQHGEIYGFVSVRASISLEKVGPEVESIVEDAIKRDNKEMYIENIKMEKQNNKEKEIIENQKEFNRDIKEKENQELDAFDLLDKGLQENKKPFIEEQLDATIKSLFTMQKVKTNISLEMLKHLIPESEYNQLETTLYQKEMESTPYNKDSGLTREEYNAIIDEEVKSQRFNISMDDNGNLTVVNHPWNVVKFESKIYIDCIECSEFLPLAQEAMQNHLERHQSYTATYSLNGAEIADKLSEAINAINNVMARAESLNRAGDAVLDEQETSYKTNQQEFDKNINEIKEKNTDLWDKNMNEIVPDDNDEPPAGGGASGPVNIGEDR